MHQTHTPTGGSCGFKISKTLKYANLNKEKRAAESNLINKKKYIFIDINFKL